MREPAFSFFKGHPGILPGSAPVPSGLVPMPAFPRTADGRPALPRTQGGSLGQHIAQGTFSHRIFQGLEIADVTAACRARSRAAVASQTGAPPYSHGRLPGKADAAGEREDEQAPGVGGGQAPACRRHTSETPPVLQVPGHAHPHPALPAVTVYQTVHSGAGALPCPANGLYFFHVFPAGNMLPVFLPAPARTGLLPRIPSHQGPSFPAVLFSSPVDTKRAPHAQRPFSSNSTFGKAQTVPATFPARPPRSRSAGHPRSCGPGRRWRW